MIKRNWREVRPVVGTHDDAIVWHIFGRKGKEAPNLAAEAAYLAVFEKQTYFVKHAIQGGRKSNPHSHETEEQLYYILKGRGVVRVGDERTEVKEGDTVYLPPQDHPPDHQRVRARRVAGISGHLGERGLG